MRSRRCTVDVIDLDRNGYRSALDQLARNCKNAGFKPSYDCDAFWNRSVWDIPPSLLLYCPRLQGMALITRNHQLALPCQVWTLQLISSKQPGCGTCLMQHWIQLAKKERVDYLAILGYSPEGKALYDKFGFVEMPSGMLIRKVKATPACSLGAAYAMLAAATELFSFDRPKRSRAMNQRHKTSLTVGNCCGGTSRVTQCPNGSDQASHFQRALSPAGPSFMFGLGN